MAENTKTQKKNWFKGLQAEFKKVVWPDKKTLARQTTAVVAVSVVLGAVIAVIDVKAKWYVVHTYSGYENKVKTNIDKAIENRHMEDQILEVRVPMEEVVELKNGVQRTVQRKMLPGYVMIHMIMNDDTWYVVRNTRGVTGFVGPGSKPVPLEDSEMENLGIKRDDVVVDFGVGDTVTVLSGAWEGTVGVVQSMNEQKKSLSINVELFGRETPVELGFSEVKKLD